MNDVCLGGVVVVKPLVGSHKETETSNGLWGEWEVVCSLLVFVLSPCLKEGVGGHVCWTYVLSDVVLCPRA